MSMPDGDPARSSAGGKQYGHSLPPVEPPTATFILQLFLIPLTIVAIVVILWLLFSWMAHMGRDNPSTLIRDLKKFDDASWQRAYELAELLRSPDPKYDALRRDPALAKQISDVLNKDLDIPATGGKKDEVRIKRRMFLARALGSFEVSEAIPALTRAARQEHALQEVEVRLSALEGLAVLASNLGPETLRQNDEVMRTVLDASKASSADDKPIEGDQGEAVLYRPHAELRAVAAYTLGVIGGEESLDRLNRMLGDAYPNARYNAATGLARNGDERAIKTLQEMLDPDNEQSVRDERFERDKDNKRVNVIQAGIQSTLALQQANPDANIAPLRESLEALTTSEMPLIKTDRGKLQGMAKEALARLDDARAAATAAPN